MIPYAVDANAIHAFQQERVKKEPGIAHAAVDAILKAHCIALDVGSICLQEWLNCAGGKFPFALGDWVADQAAVGKVRYFEFDRNCCRKTLEGYGLPRDDHKWVRLAIGSGGNRIVSDDIDFFDPKKKKASAQVKANLKAKRSGPLAKYLRKQHRVEVLCLEHVEEDARAAA